MNRFPREQHSTDKCEVLIEKPLAPLRSVPHTYDRFFSCTPMPTLDFNQINLKHFRSQINHFDFDDMF